MTIRALFEPGRQIDRPIEKVIQYDSRDPARLKQEIGEYVVTENMARSFHKLLDAIDAGMQDGSNEIGVWGAGFYGSGKSSFTKYVGFALDSDVKIDGKPFLAYLQQRIGSTALRQRFAAVASRHDPAVIMLDLASEQLAGAAMAEISTVLYTKVMQWAGYSRERKVAYLELMLERDGHLDAFMARVAEQVPGMTWAQARNQPLVASQLASRLAAEFYPELYPDARAFHEQRLDDAVKTDDQARDMVELVRRRSGRENIIFILDEVGQYVAARDPLILNLDGLAKNLKAIGGGKVWLIATAQQTLTEDDPRARINTPKLFKLQARFPVQVDLEATDIREICWRRLLTKSAEGGAQLDALYDQSGQQLRFNTQLHNTRYYRRELDKAVFGQLYPFLPQHFDILLELLGRLAKNSGGVGLRSAIKVIQDVLISADSATGPLADQPIGALATTVTFYDTLRRDLLRADRQLVEAVDRAVKAFGGNGIESRTAKTIAILQVLEDFPVSRENIAALLHPSVDAPSQLPGVQQAVTALMEEGSVPLAEIDGSLRFLSEAVSALEQERRGLLPIAAERARVTNRVIEELFTPLPRASLNGSRTVQCGIRAQGVAGPAPIAGDKEEIQLMLELTAEAELDALKRSRIGDATQPAHQATLFLIAPEPQGFRQQIEEIHRSEAIANKYRAKTVDKPVGDYLSGQQQRAEALKADLAHRLRQALEQGLLIFRGRPEAVGTLGAGLTEAVRKQLETAAQAVFHKYHEAPVQADAGLAERFLKTERLDRIETRSDPLGLVAANGTIDTGHAALRSVLDVLHQTGREEGRALLDRFSRAPYGWSKDTLRYLVAALLTAGEIKLRVSGEDITVRGRTAMDNLKSNAAFNRVGVDLRDGGVDPDSLLRAAERLLALTGDDVLPLEDDISKVVTKHFPDLQRDYAHLPSELRNLGLPGAGRADGIQDSLSEILKGDASDAAARLGPEQCPLSDDLQWARAVDKALKGHLPGVIRQANRYRRELAELAELPAEGALAQLQQDTADALDRLGELLGGDGFHDHAVPIQARVAAIEEAVATAGRALADEYAADLAAAKARLESDPDWPRIGGDAQDRLAGRIDALAIDVPPDLDGIRTCLNARYPMGQQIARIEQELRRLVEDMDRPSPGGDGEAETDGHGGSDATARVYTSELRFPAELRSREELDNLIARLTELRAAFEGHARIIFGRTPRP